MACSSSAEFQGSKKRGDERQAALYSLVTRSAYPPLRALGVLTWQFFELSPKCGYLFVPVFDKDIESLRQLTGEDI